MTPSPLRRISSKSAPIGLDTWSDETATTFSWMKSGTSFWIPICTSTDVKDDPIAFAQDLLEISTDWVGYVVGRNGDYVFLDEKRHFVLDSDLHQHRCEG